MSDAQQPAVASTVPVASPVPAVRTMMWHLESDGWTEREAGNLVALVHGLHPAASGWRQREIDHLRFLRAIVQSGRLDH
jgi:hypothetical protein